MISEIQTLVLLLFVTAAAGIVGRRLKVPPSILLVVIGVALALLPGLPTVALSPEFFLLMVLPPVVYSSSVAMSWKEFCFNLRAISLLAVGCVVFTTLAVAAASHWLLGLPWPIGFVLGAIVSPPDAVAPLSIARRMQLPRRILVVLEGEGLANDATALILYRFAIAAVSAGSFSLGKATGLFAAIVAGEIAWGIAVGWSMLRLRRWVRDPNAEMLLSILTPFVAFWPPQHLGGSGVLATVAVGLYVSWNGLKFISPATRLQGIFFWEVLINLIDGMVFLITGLQARALMSGVGHHPLQELLVSAAVVSAIVIGARFVWVYPATYLPRQLIPALRARDPSPPWQWPFAIAFTGVRGIVSVAAALAIPLTDDWGTPFPERDLVLFLTFAVILVTLVGQGLLLPPVIRALGLEHAGRREHHTDRTEELTARRLANEAAIERLEALADERKLPPEMVRRFRSHYRERVQHYDGPAGEEHPKHDAAHVNDEVELALIDAEREHVNAMYRDGRLKDEARRRIERELDLRVASLTNHSHD
jgi:monovalent cation/hydrogen antiporter